MELEKAKEREKDREMQQTRDGVEVTYDSIMAGCSSESVPFCI